MGNQLVNSMVRGFGMTLGRKAANAVTTPSVRKVSKNEQKRLDLIQEHKKNRQDVLNIIDDINLKFDSGQITETEKNILLKRTAPMLKETEEWLVKLEGAETKSKSSWPVIIGMAIGFYFVYWVFTNVVN